MFEQVPAYRLDIGEWYLARGADLQWMLFDWASQELPWKLYVDAGIVREATRRHSKERNGAVAREAYRAARALLLDDTSYIGTRVPGYHCAGRWMLVARQPSNPESRDWWLHQRWNARGRPAGGVRAGGGAKDGWAFWRFTTSTLAADADCLSGDLWHLARKHPDVHRVLVALLGLPVRPDPPAKERRTSLREAYWLSDDWVLLHKRRNSLREAYWLSDDWVLFHHRSRYWWVVYVGPSMTIQRAWGYRWDGAQMTPVVGDLAALHSGLNVERAARTRLVDFDVSHPAEVYAIRDDWLLLRLDRGTEQGKSPQRWMLLHCAVPGLPPQRRWWIIEWTGDWSHAPDQQMYLDTHYPRVRVWVGQFLRDYGRPGR